MEQLTLTSRKRIQPRIDEKVARLAKSKAVAQDVTLEFVVEKLLAGWIAGRYKLVELTEEK